MGPCIKDRILLVDLGFYKNQMFVRVEENGGFFVSRIKKNMDPIVVSIEEGVPKIKCKEFIGKPISECIQQRWDIELLFKELKSRYALDVLETKNVQIIEAFIWTAMLTLIVSRRIYSLVKNSIIHPKEKFREEWFE